MLTTSKIAISLALALGTVSAATAVPRHPVHHQRAAVERQVPAGREGNAVLGGSAYGYAAPFRVPQPNAGAGIGTNFLSSGCGLDGC